MASELRLSNPDERKDAVERMSNRHRLKSAVIGHVARTSFQVRVCKSSSLYRLREVIRALTK